MVIYIYNRSVWYNDEKGKSKRQVILRINKYYSKQLLDKAYLAYFEPILTKTRGQPNTRSVEKMQFQSETAG